MQTKGKKKIIDNAGALQKKYAWKSEKTQDTKKAPQDTKKQAAACPYAKKCGGCDYQGMSYEQQLQEKQTYVRKNIGDYCKVLPIIGMENPYHYRNKVHAVFDVERRGKHANGGLLQVQSISSQRSRFVIRVCCRILLLGLATVTLLITVQH